MKRFFKLSITLAVFSFFLTGCTIKTMENNRRTVSVSGAGTVEVEADNATVTLAVITRSKDVSVAADENASKMTKVQDAITLLGIPSENITTEGYTVYQEHNYSNGKNIPGDYNVTNRIKIFVKDLPLVSKVIDTSLKNGANELQSCQYGISNKDMYVKQARILAVQNAQEAASLIAGTGGAVLGKILTVTEHKNSFSGRNFAMKSSAANDEIVLESAAASTPINAGKTSITINVDATFELK